MLKRLSKGLVIATFLVAAMGAYITAVTAIARDASSVESPSVETAFVYPLDTVAISRDLAFNGVILH